MNKNQCMRFQSVHYIACAQKKKGKQTIHYSVCKILEAMKVNNNSQGFFLKCWSVSGHRSLTNGIIAVTFISEFVWNNLLPSSNHSLQGSDHFISRGEGSANSKSNSCIASAERSVHRRNKATKKVPKLYLIIHEVFRRKKEHGLKKTTQSSPPR